MLIDCTEVIANFLVKFGLASLPKGDDAKPMPTVPPALKSTTEKPDHVELWNSCVLTPSKLTSIKNTCAQMKVNVSRYQTISDATKVPWQVIACIHKMESDCNWKTHLHNGDSLNARTVHVPAGRPVKGNPPFTFEDSAIDALGYDGACGIKDWNLRATLEFLERYNGLGYRKHGIYSPYLWSGTNHYSKGKYVADGKWDVEDVSDQIGVVCFLKELGYGKV